MLGMPIPRDPQTGRPDPNKRTRRKLSKAAKELQEKAILTLRQELEAGRQGKRSFAECCREFHLSPDMVRNRMVREDWSTPDRITKRKAKIVAEAQGHEGRIFRPNGATKTDMLALDQLRDESIEIRVLIEPAPPKPEDPGITTKKVPSIRKSLEFNGSVRVKGKPDPRETERHTDTSKNFPDTATSPPSVTPSNTATSARSPEVEDSFDEKVARLAEQSLTRFHDSGGLIPIHKVGDLKAVDELYRRATRQKSGTETRRSIVQIGVLSSLSQEAVSRETSRLPQPVEDE